MTLQPVHDIVILYFIKKTNFGLAVSQASGSHFISTPTSRYLMLPAVVWLAYKPNSRHVLKYAIFIMFSIEREPSWIRFVIRITLVPPI